MRSNKILTTAEAAAYLGKSRQWFWSLAKKYRLKPVQEYGTVKLYALDDIKRIKRLQKVKHFLQK